MWVSGSSKCLFFGKFGVLCFLITLFWDLPFCLITEPLSGRIRKYIVQIKLCLLFLIEYIYWTCVCSSRQVSLDSWKLWHWNNFSGFCFSFCVADLEHVYSYREAQSHQRRSLNIFIQLIRPNKWHTLTLSLWDICSNIFYIFEQVWEY